MGSNVTLNEVKGTISSMAPFAALRVTEGYCLHTPSGSGFGLSTTSR